MFTVFSIKTRQHWSCWNESFVIWKEPVEYRWRIHVLKEIMVFYWSFYLLRFVTKILLHWVLHQTYWITSVSTINIKYLNYWLVFSKVGIKTFFLYNLEFPKRRQQVSNLRQNCLAWKYFKYLNMGLRHRNAKA